MSLSIFTNLVPPNSYTQVFIRFLYLRYVIKLQKFILFKILSNEIDLKNNLLCYCLKLLGSLTNFYIYQSFYSKLLIGFSKLIRLSIRCKNICIISTLRI